MSPSQRPSLAVWTSWTCLWALLFRDWPMEESGLGQRIDLSLSLSKSEDIFPFVFPFVSIQASQLEELFPVQRQLCLHGFLLSPVPPPRVSLSRPTGSPEQSLLLLLSWFKCSLSVCCSQTVPLRQPLVHSRVPLHQTVYMDGCPLSKWMLQGAEKMKSQP